MCPLNISCQRRLLSDRGFFSPPPFFPFPFQLDAAGLWSFQGEGKRGEKSFTEWNRRELFPGKYEGHFVPGWTKLFLSPGEGKKGEEGAGRLSRLLSDCV